MISWILLALSGTAAMAGNGATVILLRGSAQTSEGRELHLKDEVAPGTEIRTAPKSFVKLLFADQTQINIGPASALKLEATRAGEASLVNLVAGQLRAKVTKDPLRDPSGAPVEKMIVKTRTAAMGIRGTDFNVSYNPVNHATALITFEGNVAMTRLERNQAPLEALHRNQIVQSVGPGQFSGVQPNSAVASVPVRISPVQLTALKGNESFQGLGEKPAAKPALLASPIPPGVDAKAFSSSSPATPAPDATAGKSAPAEGFFNAQSGAYAPRAGGFIDLGTAKYIPPPAGSSYDPNTNTYVPPKAMGEVNPATGMYVPPKGVELDPVKGFVPESTERNPSSTGGKGSAGSAAQAAALNSATAANTAGQTVSYSNTFAPTTAGTVGAAAPAGTNPPPAFAPPPPNLAALPPPPKEPVSDAYCPTCIRDNVQNTPTDTNVRFHITTL